MRVSQPSAPGASRVADDGGSTPSIWSGSPTSLPQGQIARTVRSSKRAVSRIRMRGRIGVSPKWMVLGDYRNVASEACV